jgi:transcriptional regulator with XRE-family HTH domain
MVTIGSGVNRKLGAAYLGGLPFGSMPGEEPQTFADRLRSAMTDRKIGQNELDRLCGFKSSGYVNRLLHGSRGKRPSHETIRALAKQLHVREEWLADGEEPMRPDYGTLSPREKAIATGREYDLMADTYAEFEARYPETANPDEPGTWWLERLLGLDKDVRLRLAEHRATKRFQRLAREVNDHRSNPPEKPAAPRSDRMTGTHQARRRK